MFVEIAVLWRTLRKNNEIKQVNLHNHEIKFTLLTLKPDIWKKTVHSQSFWKQKILKFLFANGPIKFKFSTIQLLKTLKQFALTWPLGKQPSN